MAYSTFCQTQNDQLKEPMFFGQSVNVARYDQQKHDIFERLIEISETIHSRSYTHIIRNIVNNPGQVFDDIVTNEQILKRAGSISHFYDDLIEATSVYHLHGEGTHRIGDREVTISLRELKKKLYLCLMSVNALEAIRFYVSFACSFAFAERELMEGNAKIIKMIARDEALHLTGTQHMLNLMRSGNDDPDMAEIAVECEQACFELFKEAALQEKEWAESEQGHPLPVRGVHHKPAYGGGGPATGLCRHQAEPHSLDQHLALLRQRAGSASGSGSELLSGGSDRQRSARRRSR